jgi:hypothetical protein
MRLTLIASLALAAIASPAIAQSPPPAAFDSIRSSANYNTVILTTYKNYEASLSTHCADLEITAKQPPHILAAFQLNDKGEILNAAWKEVEDGTACGQHRRYNALVVFREGKATVIGELPGETISSPILQRDSVPYENTAVAAGPDCKSEVLDTHLVNGLPTRQSNGILSPWDEHWDIRSCGKNYVVTMHFIPDATGTTIRTSPGETVKQ